MNVKDLRRIHEDMSRSMCRLESGVNACERAGNADDEIFARCQLDRALTDVECDVKRMQEMLDK